MTQLQEWAEQYRSELEKESSARASQLESLLFAGDFDAIREWIDQWQQEDETPDSLRQQYRSVRSELRKERHRQHQRQLYGSVINRITGRASADSLDGSSASTSQTTDFQSKGMN
jgi:exonuclease III